MGAEPNGLGRNAINSYEDEVPPMSMLVRLDEHALHESNIGSEFERGRRPGFRIRARPTEIDVGFTDESFKVGNQGRIAATGMGTGGIGRDSVACHRAWEKKVGPGGLVMCGIGNGEKHFPSSQLSSSALTRDGLHNPELNAKAPTTAAALKKLRRDIVPCGEYTWRAAGRPPECSISCRFISALLLNNLGREVPVV
jgi:hypothetical protein